MLGSAQLDIADPRQGAARDFARRVIRALPPLELSPFHLELFVRFDGSLVFCEVAARLGGGLIPEALTRATGQNPARLTLRLAGPALRSAFRWPAGYPALRFPARPTPAGLLIGIRQQEPAEWLDSFHLRTAFPRQITEATASTDTIMSFVCHGATNTELRTRLDICARLASQLARWGDDGSQRASPPPAYADTAQPTHC